MPDKRSVARDLQETRNTLALFLNRAAMDGVGKYEVDYLSAAIPRIQAGLGYASLSALARDVGVSARVLGDRTGKYPSPPRLYNYQRIVQGLMDLCDRFLSENVLDAPIEFRGYPAEWRLVPASMAGRITEVGRLLAEIVLEIRGRNDTVEIDQIIDPVRRAQLIAALETTLAILKAPMVEVGFLQRVQKMLKGLAGKMLGTGLDQISKKVADVAADKLDEIISELIP
ncbi:MAG TPA: hypothetical protein VHZ32_04605 [Rhizomicrobium sp.]|jgi:hypothetical protein|nr:hypothetical protein [Rhizomicrobium sp.]